MKSKLLQDSLDIWEGHFTPKKIKILLDKLDLFQEVVKHPIGETLQEKMYAWQNQLFEIPSKCYNCGSNMKFLNYNKGYKIGCCSVTCAALSQQKQSNFKNTCMEHYGVMHPMRVAVVKQKIVDTCMSVYGVRNALLTQNAKDGFQKKYPGLTNVSQSMQWKNKTEETFQNKWGGRLHGSKIISDKIDNTMMEKYGAINPTQSDVIKRKIRLTHYKNWLTPKLIASDFSCDHEVDSLSYDINEITFTCNKCNSKQVAPLFSLIKRCYVCNPRIVSRFEDEIFKYLTEELGINELDISRRDRKIIQPLEIDLWLPKFNVGIEFHGLYWHSFNSPENNEEKNYHANKANEAINKGIKLLQIFENEWLNKKDIVKSILINALGKVDTKIYARKCQIRKINHAKEARLFLDANHIQGFCSSTYAYGLYFEDKLVEIVTMGKSRFSKKADFELLRSCTLRNTIVVGGFSKLFKHIVNENDIHSIITYADRRYFSGASYKNVGFTFSHTTSPNYFYFHNKIYQLENRMKYQKHRQKGKLPVFDEKLTEAENMFANGYRRIWDAGNECYILK